MLRTDVVFHASRGATSEELIERSSIYFEALKEIPTERIREVFSMARKEGEHFPKPKKLIEKWLYMRSEDRKWKDQEEKKIATRNYYQDLRENPNDYPTPEQHEGAIKVIMAVLDGRLTMDRGEEVMAGVLSGEIQ